MIRDSSLLMRVLENDASKADLHQFEQKRARDSDLGQGFYGES